MSFAAIDNLDRADLPSDGAQAIGIREEQVRAFVGTGAAGESDGEDFGIELRAGAALDLVEEVLLRFLVSGANFFERNADGVAKVVVVGALSGEVFVEELTERLRGPRERVHAVGDGADRVSWEHAA
jgi:hypothetical protein